MSGLIDTGDRVALSLLDQAASLDREARRHKRLAQHHRRQAREFRARLAALEDRLARMGVRLVVEGEAPRRRHGRSTGAPPVVPE